MPSLIVQEGYRQVREFVIPEGDSTVGRNADCDLALGGRGVSRQHMRVERRGNEVKVRDLGSRNGTFLNSTPIREACLIKHRDVIQLGDTMLVYNEMDDGTEEPTVSGDKEAPVFDLDYLQGVTSAVIDNIKRVIQGKDDVIRKMVVALLSDGHVLIEDVPGVGKTMLAQALAKSIRTEFKRIQFTPDLLPTDVTGVSVYDEKSKSFVFIPGPIFANVILADEINRGTPRTQSSLLECMAESRVTVDGTPHVLQKPFFVMATQNPVDFHGTYPLPEAQLDRFLMRLCMGYPGRDVEAEILGSQVFSHPINDISYVAAAADILQCQALVRTVHVSDPVKDYIVTLVEATREHPALAYGASPRASLALMRASQAQAAMDGRDYVLPRDARDLARAVLCHRLPLRLQARAEVESSDQVVAALLDEMPIEQWEQA